LKKLIITFILSLPSSLLAVANPTFSNDAGTLERTLPQMQQSLPERTDKKLIKDEAELKNEQGPTVSAKKFKLTGNHLIKTEELQVLIKSYNNNALSINDLEKITQAIGELYRKKGYWARAYLPDQNIEQEEIWIDIIEAKLGSIRIETNEEKLRFSKDRALSFIERGQAKGAPLKILELENSIRQLDDVAGVTAAVVLDRGQNPGETDVVVKMANTAYIQGSMRVDNNGSRATGYNRGILYLTLDSPFKLGEQFNLQYVKTRDMDYFSLGAAYPIRDDGTEINYMYTNMDYKLGHPLKDLKALGASDTNVVTLSRPFFKGFDTTIKGSISYAQKNYFNEAASAIVSDKSIDAFTASGIINETDTLLGGGLTAGSLSFVSGNLDLSKFQDNLTQDQNTTKTNGHFSKIGMNLVRIQQLGEKDTVWLTGNAQFANKNLDSAEKMSLGGASAVRGYPSAEANGDDAIVINAELRHQLTQNFQATLFYDWGRVTLYKTNWENWNASNTAIPNEYTLKSAGIGCRWRPFESYEFVANLAYKIGKNPGANTDGNEADGTNKNYQGWLSLTKVF